MKDVSGIGLYQIETHLQLEPRPDTSARRCCITKERRGGLVVCHCASTVRVLQSSLNVTCSGDEARDTNLLALRVHQHRNGCPELFGIAEPTHSDKR
jgi:hypothetical protein